MAIYVEKIPNRNSPPAILIRKAWREGKRIRRQTLANISKLPPSAIASIRTILKGGVVFESLERAVTLRRALPHGHVAAVLGLCGQLCLHRTRSRQRDRGGPRVSLTAGSCGRRAGRAIAPNTPARPG